jgi:hypothetical protein
MSAPLSVKKNDYRKNPKRSDIYTPPAVCQFLCDLLYPLVKRRGVTTILDPAIGSGNLIAPWRAKQCHIVGVDTNWDKPDCNVFINSRYEDIRVGEIPKPDLVLMNPPFNQGTGRKLYPELFLQKTFELFGVYCPVVVFTPMGLLKNQRKSSKRWRWLRDCGAELTSIISLPLDIFPGVLFHSEILIFNVDHLAAHYFLPDEALA